MTPRGFVGLDIGSSATKGLLVGRDGSVRSSALRPTGAKALQAARAVLDALLRSAGVPREEVTVYCTGYGRELPDFGARRPTEIASLAMGVHELAPSARSAIDVGGQDLKVVSIGPDGRHTDFLMNDRCAAGTGRFLEVMARVLDVPLEEIGPESLRSSTPAKIASMCTVFAESEVVSRVAQGAERADILAGVHDSAAERIAAQAGRMGLEGDVVLAGGGALNTGLVKALERKLGRTLLVPLEPQFLVALGAALLARRDGTDGFAIARCT